jgi:carbon storage regulator
VLVFTRKRGQSVTIGDGIEIRVLSVGRDGVRLGVSAPPDVAVHRREIYDQIREANASAAAGTSQVNRLVERLRLGAGRARTRP